VLSKASVRPAGPKILVYYCKRKSSLTEDQMKQRRAVERFQKANEKYVLSA